MARDAQSLLNGLTRKRKKQIDVWAICKVPTAGLQRKSIGTQQLRKTIRGRSHHDRDGKQPPHPNRYYFCSASRKVVEGQRPIFHKFSVTASGLSRAARISGSSTVLSRSASRT